MGSDIRHREVDAQKCTQMVKNVSREKLFNSMSGKERRSSGHSFAVTHQNPHIPLVNSVDARRTTEDTILMVPMIVHSPTV